MSDTEAEIGYWIALLGTGVDTGGGAGSSQPLF